MNTWIKASAVITACCYSFLFIFAQAVEGTIDIRRSHENTTRRVAGLRTAGAFTDLHIPVSVGRVTGCYAPESAARPVFPEVILIQDLHCHAGVQYSIAKILGLIEERCSRRGSTFQPAVNVLVEGGYGGIDTSWLAHIRDRELKKALAGELVDEGKLTGSEYYSIVHNKPHLLQGLDDERVHRENIARLREIFCRQAQWGHAIQRLKKEAASLESQYLGRRNRNFSAVLRQYRSGAISPARYYGLLARYVEKIRSRPQEYNNVFGISLEKYPNIKTYCGLTAGRGPRSGEAAAYRNLNPLDLLDEERRLVGEIRLCVSLAPAELDAVFIGDFLSYLEEYFSAGISADGYARFKRDVHTFKETWGKYGDGRCLDALAPGFPLLDEYYAVNIRRNHIFLENILRETRRPGVTVAIAGGFHTAALQELLKENGVSFLTITPQSGGDARAAHEVYTAMVRAQSVIRGSAIQPPLRSEGSPEDKFTDTVGALSRLLQRCNPGLSPQGVGKALQTIGYRGVAVFRRGALLEVTAKDLDDWSPRGAHRVRLLRAAVATPLQRVRQGGLMAGVFYMLAYCASSAWLNIIQNRLLQYYEPVPLWTFNRSLMLFLIPALFFILSEKMTSSADWNLIRAYLTPAVSLKQSLKDGMKRQWKLTALFVTLLALSQGVAGPWMLMSNNLLGPVFAAVINIVGTAILFPIVDGLIKSGIVRAAMQSVDIARQSLGAALLMGGVISFIVAGTASHSMQFSLLGLGCAVGAVIIFTGGNIIAREMSRVRENNDENPGTFGVIYLSALVSLIVGPVISVCAHQGIAFVQLPTVALLLVVDLASTFLFIKALHHLREHPVIAGVLPTVTVVFVKWFSGRVLPSSALELAAYLAIFAGMCFCSGAPLSSLSGAKMRMTRLWPALVKTFSAAGEFSVFPHPRVLGGTNGIEGNVMAARHARTHARVRSVLLRSTALTASALEDDMYFCTRAGNNSLLVMMDLFRQSRSPVAAIEQAADRAVKNGTNLYLEYPVTDWDTQRSELDAVLGTSMEGFVVDLSALNVPSAEKAMSWLEQSPGRVFVRLPSGCTVDHISRTPVIVPLPVTGQTQGIHLPAHVVPELSLNWEATPETVRRTNEKIPPDTPLIVNADELRAMLQRTVEEEGIRSFTDVIRFLDSLCTKPATLREKIKQEERAARDLCRDRLPAADTGINALVSFVKQDEPIDCDALLAAVGPRSAAGVLLKDIFQEYARDSAPARTAVVRATCAILAERALAKKRLSAERIPASRISPALEIHLGVLLLENRLSPVPCHPSSRVTETVGRIARDAGVPPRRLPAFPENRPGYSDFRAVTSLLKAA